MNNRKRMGMLLGCLVLLLIANVLIRWNDDPLEGRRLFGSSFNLDYSPRVEKIISDLERVPRLSFEMDRQREALDVVNLRNPFIFGVDRRKEAARKARLVEMEKAREAARKVAAPEPPPVVEDRAFDGRLIGVMMDSGGTARMISIILDAQINIVREGEILAGRYRLDKIGEQQIHFHDLETRKEIRIDVEQQE